MEQHGNLHYISNQDTWFQLDDDGDEIFDIWKVIDNVNYGLGLASMSSDCAIVLEVNQYVPPGSIDRLRRNCEKACADGELFGWYFRGDYLAGQMFHANLRRPWIFPLPAKVRLTADGVLLDGVNIKLPHLRGNWPEENSGMVIDAQLELTPKDWEAKLNFIRCYKELEPSRSAVFEWDYWFPYMVNKYRKKHMGGEMDEIGLKLFARRQPDFVSFMVLSELRK